MPSRKTKPKGPARFRLPKALMASVPLLLLVLLLLLLEGLPRLLWGQPPTYDMLVRVSQVHLAVTDDRATLLADMPGGSPRSYLVAHGARPRVVVLGGSSVMEPGPRAFPYQLADLAPDLDIINLGAHGIPAANLIVLAKQIKVLKPDLVIVYTGHNDYSQDVFRGAIAGTRLWLVPWYRFASRSWLHYWLAGRVRGTPQRMDLRLRHTLATQDPTALQVRDQVDARFEHDLGEILDHSPAPVLLATLLRNADAPPTGVLTAGLPDCEGALKGLLRQAPIFDRVDRSAQVCGESSITWWLRSQAWARTRPDDALAAFDRSLDLDAMPMRAPSQADTIIRRVAARHGATLVDLQAALGPLPPGRWFTDPIHFSNAGAAKVAKLLLPAVRAALEKADGQEKNAAAP